MQITLNQDDINKLTPQTRDELMSILFPKPVVRTVEGAEGFDWEGVVAFTLADIEHFIEGCSEQTIKGLQIFAKHGPIIHTDKLHQVGITNYGSFQGSCTKRARTVSGNSNAYLLAWDDWDEYGGESGKYAVSAMTYKSLREYFSKHKV